MSEGWAGENLFTYNVRFRKTDFLDSFFSSYNPFMRCLVKHQLLKGPPCFRAGLPVQKRELEET